jgi:hypothetical protein
MVKTARFEVLSQGEVERIHAASMEIPSAVGIKVDYQTARDLFRQAGTEVDDEAQCVRIPEKLVQWAVEQAPARFTLYGSDPDFEMEIGAGTFGAFTKEQVTGIPLQYNLLTLDPQTGEMTVSTWKKERPNGAWSADARWGDKNDPKPWYSFTVPRYQARG